MKLISERSANRFFGNIKQVHSNNGHSAAERVPKIGAVLENLFRELTQNDLQSKANLFERMDFAFKTHNPHKHIVDIAHSTRKICNEIRHNGLVPNDKDYQAAVEAVGECINYFSDVEIPLDVQAIYNSSIVVPNPSVIVQPEPPKKKDIAVAPPLTIRQKDLINNPAARLPIALLLDCSGSMTIDNRIGELNQGVEMFFHSVLADEVTRYSVEMCIITFGRIAEKILDFAGIERQSDDFRAKMPLTVKNVTDGTPMGEAVELALKLLQERKEEYRIAGVDYFQPWLVLMTDGQPTDSIENASTLTAELVRKRKLSLFSVAIGDGANLTTLSKFSPLREPLKLKGLNFREFFEWLRESAKSTSQSTPGQSINLPPISWATL